MNKRKFTINDFLEWFHEKQEYIKLIILMITLLIMTIGEVGSYLAVKDNIMEVKGKVVKSESYIRVLDGKKSTRSEFVLRWEALGEVYYGNFNDEGIVSLYEERDFYVYKDSPGVYCRYTYENTIFALQFILFIYTVGGITLFHKQIYKWYKEYKRRKKENKPLFLYGTEEEEREYLKLKKERQIKFLLSLLFSFPFTLAFFYILSGEEKIPSSIIEFGIFSIVSNVLLFKTGRSLYRLKEYRNNHWV
ncbi:MAG: hypothetical protein ACRC2K_07410 [Clostridium sp.]